MKKEIQDLEFGQLQGKSSIILQWRGLHLTAIQCKWPLEHLETSANNIKNAYNIKYVATSLPWRSACQKHVGTDP